MYLKNDICKLKPLFNIDYSKKNFTHFNDHFIGPFRFVVGVME